MNCSLGELEQNRIASWEKEIDATQSNDRDQVLDYAVWFSPYASDVKRPLTEWIPPAPWHNLRIRRLMKSWATDMSNKLLFPQFQVGKSISRLSAAEYHNRISGSWEVLSDVNVTTADLERYYAATGMTIPGPCEIRQTWGYNDITPRTYFTPGGDTFDASKYIRDVVNTLASQFEEVNFVSRFNLHDLELDQEITAFIYDYISFTSRMAEQKYFLEALAAFTDDVVVRLVDSNLGIVAESLGSLIRRYNDVCNRRPGFTVNRYQGHCQVVLEHKVAGFLGVYGNITSCTTVHGLHACQICGDDSRCRCVGDDVFGTIRLSRDFDREDMSTAIESLGDINREKIELWSEDDSGIFDATDDKAWAYLKRPLYRFNHRMILERALFLPMFGRILGFEDDVRQTREDLYTRAKLLAVQSLSCVKQIESLDPKLDKPQQDLIRSYLCVLYQSFGISEEGHLPGTPLIIKNVNLTHLFYPNVKSEGCFTSDPWGLLKHQYDERLAIRVPRILTSEEDPGMRLYNGSEVEWVMSKPVAYLLKMDWAVSEQLFEERVFDWESFVRYQEDIMYGNVRFLYKIRVIVRNTVVHDLSVEYTGCAPL